MERFSRNGYTPMHKNQQNRFFPVFFSNIVRNTLLVFGEKIYYIHLSGQFPIELKNDVFIFMTGIMFAPALGKWMVW